MKRTHYFTILSCVLFTAFMLTGCSTPSSTIKPASYSEYIEADFKEFSSGLFYDDFFEKFVKVDCRYSESGKAPMPPYSSLEYIEFSAHPSANSLYKLIRDYITVVVHKSIAKEVFYLKSGDEITVYGQALGYHYTNKQTQEVNKALLIKADHVVKK